MTVGFFLLILWQCIESFNAFSHDITSQLLKNGYHFLHQSIWFHFTGNAEYVQTFASGIRLIQLAHSTNLFSRFLYFVAIASSHTILRFTKITLVCSIASSPTILKFANIPLIYNHIPFFFNVFKLNPDIRENLFTKAPFNYPTPF